MNKDTKVVIIVGICCCLIILGIFGLARLNKSTQEENSNQSSSVETSYEGDNTDNTDYANSNNEESVPELLDEDDFDNSQYNSSEENSMESSGTEETSNEDNNDDIPEQVGQTNTDDAVSDDNSDTYSMDNYYYDTGEDISVDLTKYTPYYIDDKRYYIDNDVFKQYTESILIDYANNIKDTELYAKILDITKSEDIVISESYYDEYGYHALMSNDEYYFFCDIKYDGSYEVVYCDSENNCLDSLSGSYIDEDSYDDIAMKSLLRK